MSTNLVELKPGAWVLAYTGPTTKAISVEKQQTGSDIWLAIGTDVPAFTENGHALTEGSIKSVELDEGENLYAWCTKGVNGAAVENLIITD